MNARRSVWTLDTWEELLDLMIRAGTSQKGVCPECGAPWVREVETTYTPLEDPEKNNAEPRAVRGSHGRIGGGFDGTHGSPASMKHGRAEKKVTTLGWHPSCAHDGEPIPATILDPFAGSGTALLVARQLGRHAIGIELNERYAAMCKARMSQLSLLA